MKMPMFVWTSLLIMVLVISAFPIPYHDAYTSFFGPDFGMHFFTADVVACHDVCKFNGPWGHPEVYILMIPAFGSTQK